jgi:hypothetical protein
MTLSMLSVSFDDTRIQSPLGEDFYKGLWSKLNSKFQYFLDSLDLKPSANIFIIKFGNAIWHLTSNGNLFLLKYNTV